jgi:uncharacterized protein
MFKMRRAFSSRKTAAVLAAFFFSVLFSGCAHSQDAPQQLPLDPQPLEIVTPAGIKTYLIEVADDNSERGIGLMNRKSMPEGQGMLFDFQTARLVQMWMKNTYVPLDILFIGENGRIESIAANTVPQSLDIIGSKYEVRFALELVAGTAMRAGIKPGDQVRHRVINAVSRAK